jgi:hypothetical protein
VLPHREPTARRPAGAEALPGGVAAASLGATSDTSSHGQQVGGHLCDALLAGTPHRRTGRAPASPIACAPYRLIGDPRRRSPPSTSQFDRAAAVPTWPDEFWLRAMNLMRISTM